MTQIIHVGGAKGVGKTTLLRELNGIPLENGKSLNIIHMSDFLNEFSMEIYNIQWDKLNDGEKKGLRLKAAEKIACLPYDVLLLDSHCIDMVNEKPVRIIPPEFESIIDGYMVVTSSPEIIYGRRQKDNLRSRDLQLSIIQTEMEYELLTAKNLAAKKSLDVVVIDNYLPEKAKSDILQGIIRILKEVKISKEGNRIEYESSFHHIERF